MAGVTNALEEFFRRKVPALDLASRIHNSRLSSDNVSL